MKKTIIALTAVLGLGLSTVAVAADEEAPAADPIDLEFGLALAKLRATAPA